MVRIPSHLDVLWALTDLSIDTVCDMANGTSHYIQDQQIFITIAFPRNEKSRLFRTTRNEQLE